MTERTEPSYLLAAMETMEREKLAALQLTRLRKTLAHAYANVAHYKCALDEAGLAPGDMESLDDVRRLPFTAKDALRDRYPFGMFAVPREEVGRVHASSGTSGKPTVVGYTEGDLNIWGGLMARSMVAAGVRPGDIVHNAYGYGLFTGGLGFHDGARRLGCTTVPVSGGLTERQIVLIDDFRPRALLCTPSYALNIAEVAEKQGVDLRGGSLEVGIFGAEPWSEAMRAELEDRLGIKAMDHYGLSEIQGPGVAGECIEGQAGLHGWEDHFLFEVVDPESGEVLPMGEAGELVITTLTKKALPMIRYRTRDITRLTDEPCVCGRTHLRILRITGRDDDMLIIRGVNLFPSQIEAALVGFPDLAPTYQLVVGRKGALDTLAIEVEAAPKFANADKAALKPIGDAVKQHLKSLLGLSARITVKGPGELPRSEGKAVRVRDLRPKD
jgi:phenylacetate-CoA ligase